MAISRKRVRLSHDIPKEKLADSPVKVRADKKKRQVDVVISIHEAARTGKESLIYQHLRDGIHIDCPDADGNTPLMIALKNRQGSAVKFLMSASASITARNVKGESAYSIARQMLEMNNPPIEELCERIVNFMRSKENLLKYRWTNFEKVITNFVKGRSQVTPLEWAHIEALFPGKKAEFLEEANELGTRRAIAMIAKIIAFNPFIQAKPVAAPSRFFSLGNDVEPNQVPVNSYTKK